MIVGNIIGGSPGKGSGESTGGIPHIEMTKAEYDALTEEEKDPEAVYFIKDTEDGNASNINNIKHITGTIEGNGSITITFKNITSALITLCTSDSTGYATYMYQGYAHSSARQHMTQLVNGGGYSHTISSDTQAITITNKLSSVTYYSIDVLFGEMPVVS